MTFAGSFLPPEPEFDLNEPFEIGRPGTCRLEIAHTDGDIRAGGRLSFDVGARRQGDRQ